MFVGWSDNELVSKKLSHKKNKAKELKEKKRKRSNSIESIDIVKSKKNKKLLKDNYESEPEDRSSYKKKPKKLREKDKGNKITGRKEHGLVESDFEDGHRNSTSERKNRLDTKGKSKRSNHKSNISDAPYKGLAYEDEYKKGLDKKSKNKGDSDHKGNSSSRKQDKESKGDYRKSSKRDKRSQRTPDSDSETMLSYERKSSKRAAHDHELEGSEERSKHSDKEYKKSSRDRHDDKFSESFERDSQNGDDNSRTSSNEKPYRYWSTSQKPIRKNSDSYWNKYSDRLKESTEPVEVGPRYYSASDEKKNEKKNPDTTKSKNRQAEKKDGAEKPGEKNMAEKKDKTEPAVQKKAVGLLTTRTGGAYIPPAKLRMMQESITDKGR